MKTGVYPAILLSLSMSSAVFAANVSIQGTIPGKVQLHQPNLSAARAVTKPIVYQRVILSPTARQNMARQVQAQLKTANLRIKNSTAIPASVSLGMNGVPVLDQGQHGTCATFATLGALDAASNDNKENGSYDRYSELCSLELGTTLEKQSPIDPTTGDPSYPSGWDGSWATFILSQISTHGAVTQSYQTTKGCAGVREYPLMNMSDHGTAISASDYESISEKAMPPVSYKVLLNADDAFTDKSDTTKLLDNVKQALNAKHRVTFGFLLDPDYGDNGAVGSTKVYADTWVLSAHLADEAKNPDAMQAGHEVIITGYDDTAVVMDPDNVSHTGILIIRNSWGDYAGDGGNYYMTYDYFKALVLESAEYVPAVVRR